MTNNKICKEDKEIEIISVLENNDIDWTITQNHHIKISDIEVGYIKTYTFTKESIENDICEDHAFYMEEDIHIRENLCSLIYENMGSNKIVYIDKLFLKKEYRGNGIGSIVLKEIEKLNPNCSFILFASALENVNEFINNKDYHNEVINKLYTFYTENNYYHHDSVFYKGIDFSKENWDSYDNSVCVY